MNDPDGCICNDCGGSVNVGELQTLIIDITRKETRLLPELHFQKV